MVGVTLRVGLRLSIFLGIACGLPTSGFGRVAVRTTETISFYVCQTALLNLGKTTVPYYVIPRSPASKFARGNFLLLPGFADVGLDHVDTIESATNAGFDVVTINYPSHGDSTGRGLGWYSLPKLVERAILPAVKAVSATAENPAWVLGGWSTGATIAEYMLQKHSLRSLGISPMAAVLITPGLPVRPLIGQWGLVTRATLAGPDSTFPFGPIRPASPLLLPPFVFPPSLFLESLELERNVYEHPRGIPTLVMLADEGDRYVDSKRAAEWVGALARTHYPIWGEVYPTPYHALEWNAIYGAPVVERVTQFLVSVSEHRAPNDFGQASVRFIAP